MSADDELLDEVPVRVLAATIATAPDENGQVMVLLAQVDGGVLRHGPCNLPPRLEGTDPARGDRCVVLEDDQGGLWVAGWRAS